MTAIKRSHFRWVIIFLLFFITMINYIDRASISYAIDEMAKEFHFNQDLMGLILGAFGIGYLLTTFLGGIVVDRYGPRHILFVAVIFWVISLISTGLSMGFFSVFLTRVLLGLAEGPNFPAMNRAVGDWLPKQERAKALAYSLVAVPISLAIGGPIVSQLIFHFSWRVMFFALGCSALLWLPFWWFLFRDFPEQSNYVNSQELQYIQEGHFHAKLDAESKKALRKNIPKLWRFLFSNKTLLVNYWAFFVFGYYLFFFMNWLPTYLLDHFHLDITKVGMFTVLPWTLSAVLLWFVGYLSDYILKKTYNLRWSRTHPIWISQLMAAICIVPIILTNQVDVAILFISLAVGFCLSANSVYYAVNIDIAKARAGTALGIMDAAFALSGFVAPALTGWIISLTGRFTSAFELLSILAISSVVLVFIFHHPEREKPLKVISAPES